MKNDLIHRVPLSAQAVELLRHARDQTGCCEGVVFPAERGGGHHMVAERLSIS